MPIAQPQNWQPHLQDAGVEPRSVLLVNAGWSPRKNHAFDGKFLVKIFDLVRGYVIRDDFRVDTMLSYSSPNQVTVLPSEIQYQNCVVFQLCCRRD